MLRDLLQRRSGTSDGFLQLLNLSESRFPISPNHRALSTGPLSTAAKAVRGALQVALALQDGQPQAAQGLALEADPGRDAVKEGTRGMDGDPVGVALRSSWTETHLFN